MSTSAVTVLTPHGRRQNVKVTPNKIILEILEEVCKKFNFNPDDYDLIHHKRILDLSIMYRFSGLPNNAQLEMTEVKKKRLHSLVTICLQLETGERITNDFDKDTFLYDILLKSLPDKVNIFMKNCYVIYMRNEIYGNQLKTTTLKKLGLSSGRAILRFVEKNPDELKSQANVSSALPLRRNSVNSEDDKSVKTVLEDTKLPIINQCGTQTESVNSITVKNDEQHDEINKNTNDKTITNAAVCLKNFSSPELKKIKINDKTNLNEIKCTNDDTDSDDEKIEINILGERNAILFSLDKIKKKNFDLPDSFFELNVNDINKILNELKKQSTGTDDAPMLTAKMRELEENKKVLNKLNQYKKTIIRIQFPDRIILQGIFTPVETINHVKQFVLSYLKDNIDDFYLFTTPPKNILKNESHLVEINCVPQALLHFGVNLNSDKTDDNLHYLKDDLYNKLTSPNGAVLEAAKSRGILIKNNAIPIDGGTQKQVCAGKPPAGKSTGAIPKQYKQPSIPLNNNTNNNLDNNQTTDGNVVPKWFKITK